MTGIVDKVKAKLGHGETKLDHEEHKHSTQTGSTNAGPYNSNAANKLDIRVDSDQDHRGNTGSTIGGYGSGTNNTPQHGSVLGTAGSGTAPHTAGPHDKDLLNKVDPRVDSDKDGSTTVGTNRTHY